LHLKQKQKNKKESSVLFAANGGFFLIIQSEVEEVGMVEGPNANLAKKSTIPTTLIIQISKNVESGLAPIMRSRYRNSPKSLRSGVGQQNEKNLNK
jgi:hypothetical protein